MKQLIFLFIVICIFGYKLNSQWSPACSTSYSWSTTSGERWPYLKVKGDTIYITGTSYDASAGTPWSIKTIKYSTACGQQWVATYTSSNDLEANGIDVDDFGNVYVVGTKYNGSDEDYITIKYNSSGTQQWATTYNGGGIDEAGAIGVVNLSGDVYVYVTGGSINTNPLSTPTMDIFTICYYSSNGSQFWANRFNKGGQWPNTNGDDKAWSLAIDDIDSSHPGYGVYVAGWYDNGNDCGGDCQRDAQLVHYDFTSGTHDGAVHYGDSGLGDDFNNAIAVSPVSHYVYTTGAKFPGDAYDFFTAGYHWTINGQLKMSWCNRYNGPGDGSDVGTSLVVEAITDSSDYVFAAGYSPGNGTGDDYTTIKYYSDTLISWYGDVEWVSRYDPGNSTYGEAFSIARNSNGKIYVTGKSGPQNSGSMVTIQYANSDGDEECVTTYNPTGNGEFGTSIGFINSDVYVAGLTNYNHSSYIGDFITLKYLECEPDGDDGRFANTTVQNSIKKDFKLNQNYPNPFNPVTTINYSIPKSSYVALNIYNVLGQNVMSIPVKYRQAGDYSELIDASNLSSGIYLYKITVVDILNPANIFTDAKKMFLIK